MKRMTLGIIAAIIIVVLVVAGAVYYYTLPAPEPTAAELVVGNINALSGPTAGYGIPGGDAFKMVIDEFNAAGGVTIGGTKYTIRIITGDEAEGAVATATLVTKMITEDNVLCITGTDFEDTAMATKAVCEQYQVPFITGSPSNPHLVEVGSRWTFVSHLNWAQVATGMLNYIEKTNWNTFCEIAQDAEYGYFLHQQMSAGLAAANKTLLKSYYVASTQTDLYSILNEIKTLNPDCILSYNIGPVTYAEHTQAKELGIETNWLAYGMECGAGFMEQVQPTNASLTYFIEDFNPYDPTEPNLSFVANLSKNYGYAEGAGFGGYTGAEIAYSLINALKIANGTTHENLQTALQHVDFTATGGRTRFGMWGQSSRDVWALTWIPNPAKPGTYSMKAISKEWFDCPYPWPWQT